VVGLPVCGRTCCPADSVTVGTGVRLGVLLAVLVLGRGRDGVAEGLPVGVRVAVVLGRGEAVWHTRHPATEAADAPWAPPNRMAAVNKMAATASATTTAIPETRMIRRINHKTTMSLPRRGRPQEAGRPPAASPADGARPPGRAAGGLPGL